jgi:hypothetical protein
MMPIFASWCFDTGGQLEQSCATPPGWSNLLTPRLTEVLQVLNEAFDGGLVDESDAA